MAAFMTASAWAEAPSTPVPNDPLTQNESCDLAIVGSGILGLCSGLHAARQGLSVRIVDAASVGDRASGLNGGQVIAGFKYDPDWLVAHFGEKRGTALAQFGASTPDAVFDLIAREKLDVPRQANGWIQAAHSDVAMRAIEQRAKQWFAYGVPAKILDVA